jgi:glyoxylase-like metal-dependent hydrolase (beta-lactamase superfamily II)
MNPHADTLTLGPVTVHFGDRHGKYPDGNQVIVRGRDTLVAFDTPCVSNRLADALGAADLVILGHVHEDHVAGLHRLPRAAVHVHEADVEAARSWDGLARHYGYPAPVLEEMRPMLERDFSWAPRPDALGYADGAAWDLGGVQVRAVHMPGHTSGHCVLLVEPHGIAFIGDIELSSFGPYYGDATSSLAQFRDTLARVARLPASAWITSHHKGVITDRDTFDSALHAFGARIDARSETLIGMLGSEVWSLDALVARRLLYPPSYGAAWVDCAERRTIAQHLDELLAAGRVARTDDGCWRATGRA